MALGMPASLVGAQSKEHGAPTLTCLLVAHADAIASRIQACKRRLRRGVQQVILHQGLR